MSMSKVFKAGDNVIDGSEPFVIQIEEKERDKRCHYCFIECDQLKSCSHCHQVMYCSKECQLKDWKDIHKFNECKLLKHFGDMPLKGDTRILIRLVLKVTFDVKSRQKSYQLWDNRQRRVNDLISHQIDPNKYKIYFLFGGTLVTNLLKVFGIKLSMIEYWHWFGVIAINAMAVGNHCKPSCFRRLNGRKLQVRAMRDIDTSVEQPTICYIDWTKDRRTRRQLLVEHYFFECQCKRCVEHSDKDFDFARYKYLLDNVRDMSIDFWDEVLALERQLVGPHFPIITNKLLKKWTAIEKTNPNPMSRPVFKQWKALAKKIEKEFLITHGRQHEDYPRIVEMWRQIDSMRRTMSL